MNFNIVARNTCFVLACMFFGAAVRTCYDMHNKTSYAETALTDHEREAAFRALCDSVPHRSRVFFSTDRNDWVCTYGSGPLDVQEWIVGMKELTHYTDMVKYKEIKP